jgi:hypothetical protein
MPKEKKQPKGAKMRHDPLEKQLHDLENPGKLKAVRLSRLFYFLFFSAAVTAAVAAATTSADV